MSDREELDLLVQQLIRTMMLNQAELARRLKVSPGTLYSWSVRRRRSSPANSTRLVEVADSHAREIAETAERLHQALDAYTAADAPHDP